VVFAGDVKLNFKRLMINATSAMNALLAVHAQYASAVNPAVTRRPRLQIDARSVLTATIIVNAAALMIALNANTVAAADNAYHIARVRDVIVVVITSLEKRWMTVSVQNALKQESVSFIK